MRIRRRPAPMRSSWSSVTPELSDLSAKGQVKEASIEAVVIRADGTREDLGTIAYWHKNPVRRLLWRITKRSE